MTLNRIALACAVVCALTACGGGGNSNSNNADRVASASRTVDGLAAKGLIRDGIVNVYAYSEDGSLSAAPIFTTRSAKTDGSYTLNLGDRSGLFTVEIGADAATTMDDEYSGTIAMPTDMVMRGLVQVDANTGATLTSYVTPFSEMLVKAALSASGNDRLTADNVANAQTELTKILGFNPLTTKPLNANTAAAAATADTSEQLQSVALAAISRIADAGGLGCHGSAGDKVKCAVAAMAGAVTMKDGPLSISAASKEAILNALADTVGNTAVNRTSLKTLDGQALFVDAPLTPGVKGQPMGALAPTKAAVAEAKAFFASLRTNMQAWTDVEQGGGLSKRAAALKTDFQEATSPVDQDLANWVVVSERGVKLFNEFVTGKSTTVWVDHVTNMGDYASCGLYKDAAAAVMLTPADTRVVPKSVYCFVSKKPLPYSVRATGVAGQFSHDQVTKTMLLKPVADKAFTYEARTLIETQFYTQDANGQRQGFLTQANPAVIGLPASGRITYAAGAETVSSATIFGYLPARVDIWGRAVTDRESWNVNFSTGNQTATMVQYNLSGQITALKGATSLGVIALKAGSYAKVMTVDGKAQLNEVKLALDVSSPASKVSGVLSLSNFSADVHGEQFAPNKVQLTGTLSNPRGEYFQGVYSSEVFNYQRYDSSAEQSATNFVTGSTSFSGSLKILTRPALTLTLAGRETGFGKTQFNGSYNDGRNVINIDGTNARPALVNLASAAGVSIKLKEGVVKVDVMKNNSKVAVLDTSTGMINYVDGSFESLK